MAYKKILPDIVNYFISLTSRRCVYVIHKSFLFTPWKGYLVLFFFLISNPLTIFQWKRDFHIVSIIKKGYSFLKTNKKHKHLHKKAFVKLSCIVPYLCPMLYIESFQKKANIAKYLPTFKILLKKITLLKFWMISCQEIFFQNIVFQNIPH